MNPLTSPVDIRPDQLEIVQNILLKHLPAGVKVWVFGSRANWTTKDSSDLDLALEGESKLSHKVLGALEDAFEDSALPYTVDVVDLNRTGDSFRQIVKSQRIPLLIDGVATSTVALAGSNGRRREIKLGDVATIVMGQSPPGSTVSDEPGVALLNGPTEFGPHHPVPVQFTNDPRKFAQPGDVLFCVRGSTTGRMNWADQEYAIGRGVAAIRHTEDPALQPLLRGVIEVALPELLTAATGSTFPNVSASQIADISYPDLDEAEQQAIAHVLGTLDDKIELNRRMNETLETMARALFKSWFVDFTPVRAKMEGRWRRGESLPGLPAEHYDLFPDRLVYSELGEIPEGWGVKALGEMSSLNPESWSKTNVPADIAYVDLANTKWGVIESTQNFVWQDAPSRARRILRSGDTIVGTVRPGNGSYSFVGNDGLTGSTGFAVLRPLHPRFRELVYLAATRPDNIERLAHRADGAAYPAVRPEMVSETEVAIPVVETGVVSWFSKTVGAILDKIESAKTESRSLTSHRDALLPRLMSGDVGWG